MTKLRTGIVLTIVATACLFSDVAAAQGSKPFARCPANAQQQADVLKVLVTHTDRARVSAEDNPLLLADVGFYEAELAATKACVPAVAMAKSAR
jgi:hypothetical protein